MGRVDIALETIQNEHLIIVKEALDRIQTIILDVLTMAKVGRNLEETEEIQLASLAEACWRSVSTAESELKIESNPRFLADPDRLQQIFENLFRNSIEYGGKMVTIRVGGLPDGAGFYVEDDGPGIPEDERTSVFERGQTTTGEGLGLGLAIVDSVIAAHDWKITVTDSVDGAARFEVRNVVVIDGLKE